MPKFSVEIVLGIRYGGHRCIERYKIKAKNTRGAILKIGKHKGLKFRCACNTGDAVRYDAINTDISVFLKETE